MTGTTTPNYLWYMPSEHEGQLGPSYHALLNANFLDIDARIKSLSDSRTASDTAVAVLQTSGVNAKTYLKGDGTTEDAADIVAFAAASAGKIGMFPPGNYVYPDGVGLTVSSNTRYMGAGAGATTISTEDAYAFQTPATGPIDRVTISDLWCSLRSGSTTGGAIKAVSNSYHSGWDIKRVNADGVTTCLNPPIWLDGYIGSYMRRCQAQGAGGVGILVDSTGFVSNAFGIYECRVAINGGGTGGTTTGAIAVHGSQPRIRDCITESNHGYGMDLSGSDALVDGNWFESNGNHNIYASGCALDVVHNKFHYNDGTIPTATHIVLTGGVLNARQFNSIRFNTFQDGSSSGVCINIGANIEDTFLMSNRGADFVQGGIVDNGTRTVTYQTDNPTGVANEWKLPGGAIPGLRIKGTTQAGDGSDVSATGLFSVADSSNQEMVGVTRKGYLVQQTPNGDPGAATTQVDGFTYFWDETAQRVRVRGRNHSGSDFVHDVSHAAAGANPDTSGASLATLETEVNQLKALLRSAGLLTP